ncbi:MAG: GGDEF domain-containing protein [Dictyoglomus sp. NZ13-RE01]|nr:MAG: GGDEF domain-containing protein [Dictyoglomus sp. NZ13-RE01]
MLNIDEIINRYSITYIDIPSGSGRTHQIQHLFSKYSNISLYTYYSSYRTPIGEFLFTLLNLSDKKKLFEEKGKYIGPILRNYIHPKFFSLLEVYEPSPSLDLEEEIYKLVQIIDLLLHDKPIKYWFIDDWLLYLDYNRFFEILIPQISEKFNIHFVITGENLPKFNNMYTLQKEKPIDVKEVSNYFNIDYKSAEKLINLGQSNWNNMKLIYKNKFKSLENIVKEKLETLNDEEKKALYSLTLIGKTFSGTTIKAVKELYGPLVFFKNFIKLGLLRFERPMWRFPSDDVLTIINRELSSINTNNELNKNLIDKLISLNYSDTWGRIATLAERIDDRRRWLYCKIKEFRSVPNIYKKIEILKEILEKEKTKKFYIRKLLRLLINTQNYQEALEILNKIEEKTLWEKALTVRCLSYLGDYDSAKKIIDEFKERPKTEYDTPEILAHFGSYYFLRKESKKGLKILGSYLEDITNTITSPSYISNYLNSLALMNALERKVIDAVYFLNFALPYANKSQNKLVLFKILNNLGDLERYVNGPRNALKYSLDAFEISKSLSKEYILISLENLVNTLSQFYLWDDVSNLIRQLKALLKEVKIEYYYYLGLRRIALIYLFCRRFEEVKELLPLLEEIEKFPESKVLINLIKGFLGENNIENLEEDILKTKEDQLITLYLSLLIERGFSSKKIVYEYHSELPFYNFLKNLILLEDIYSSFSYIDFMQERWEYLDALNSYITLTEYIKNIGMKNSENLLKTLYFEIVGISDLLGLKHIKEKYIRNVSEEFSSLHTPIKIIENYLVPAIINSQNESQAITIIHRAFLPFSQNILVRIKIGEKILEEGNKFLRESALKIYYHKFPFSIYLYSKDLIDSSIILLLRNILNAFIVFWERRYGIYDPLTELYNRSYGQKKIEEAYYEYTRGEKPFSIVFIDIDSFKKINDNLGHIYGDFILKEISRIIKRNIRQNDIAVRWGGDEFLLLLKRTNYEDAEKVIDRISKELNRISNQEINISYGIETMSPEIKNCEELIKNADLKMYSNKYKRLSN